MEQATCISQAVTSVSVGSKGWNEARTYIYDMCKPKSQLNLKTIFDDSQWPEKLGIKKKLIHTVHSCPMIGWKIGKTKLIFFLYYTPFLGIKTHTQFLKLNVSMTRKIRHKKETHSHSAFIHVPWSEEKSAKQN